MMARQQWWKFYHGPVAGQSTHHHHEKRCKIAFISKKSCTCNHVFYSPFQSLSLYWHMGLYVYRSYSVLLTILFQLRNIWTFTKKTFFAFFFLFDNIFRLIFLITKYNFFDLNPSFQGQIVSFKKFGFFAITRKPLGVRTQNLTECIDIQRGITRKTNFALQS